MSFDTTSPRYTIGGARRGVQAFRTYILFLATDRGSFRYDGYTLKAYFHDPDNPTVSAAMIIDSISKHGTACRERSQQESAMWRGH